MRCEAKSSWQYKSIDELQQLGQSDTSNGGQQGLACRNVSGRGTKLGIEEALKGCVMYTQCPDDSHSIASECTPCMLCPHC